MNLLVAALAVWTAGGLACLATARRLRTVAVLGVAAAMAGSVLALAGALPFLAPHACGTSQAEWPWAMPFGRLILRLDPLAALFTAATAAVAGLAAVFGSGYLHGGREARGESRVGFSWAFYNLLTASMVAVFLAGNALFFLLAWEIMALTSFGLVLFDCSRPEVRRAGAIYLVAAHLGTAALLAMFLLLGRETGSFDFDRMRLARFAPGVAGVAFALAVAGFGTKAGFIPLHVWLPEAHPAAPSHVSALMSGVMIKTGIYGLVRIVSLLGPPPSSWGWTLVTAGAVSGVLGVWLALAQHDLKRLLAYHSVENIGIIALGLGTGMLGLSYGSPVMAFLGFAGGLLHVANHALFKSLLFLGAGSVLHATGTREIERLGGLLKRMPSTGLSFLIGSAAICGLPPLNGFVSEFLIGLAAFAGVAGCRALPGGAAAAGAVTLVSLGLISGLAVACFTKAFGVVFLGEPRGARAAEARESGPALRLPMAALAAACVAIGLGGPVAVSWIARPAAVLAAADWVGGAAAVPSWIGRALVTAAAVLTAVPALALLLGLLRRRLVAGRTAAPVPTWDCGYAAPTARMQYTASSFAQPLLWIARHLVASHHRCAPPQGLFPASAAFASETPDVAHERVYRPAFAALERLLARVHWIQHGRLNLYILAIAAALLALLVWKMR